MPHPATAQVTEVSPGRFTCSAGQGQFERHDIGRYAEERRITGHIRFRAARRHLRWATSGALLFELEGGRVAGAYVTTLPYMPDRLAVTLKYPGSPNPPQVIRYVPIEDGVSLTVSLSPQGRLTVTSGRRSGRANIGQVTIVRSAAHCQSGEFEIEVSR